MDDIDEPSRINIAGSAATGGGHIAGRDVFNIVLNYMQEKLPNDPLPKEFEKKLDSLRTLIGTLRAWKEVHNSLDEIRSRFDQFKHPIEWANSRKQVVAHKNIKLYWRPVVSKVDIFQNRIAEVSKIEDNFSYKSLLPYEDRYDDVVECKKKSYVLIDLSKNINLHMGDSYNLYSKQLFSPSYEHTIQNIKSKLGLRNHWWLYLTDLTDEMDNNLSESMYIADKILRSTADYLHEFSQSTFGNTGGLK
jgi:hypothetical protein